MCSLSSGCCNATRGTPAQQLRQQSLRRRGRPTSRNGRTRIPMSKPITLQDVFDELTGMEGKLTTLEGKVTTLEGKADDKLTTLEGKVDGLEAKVNETKANVNRIGERNLRVSIATARGEQFSRPLLARPPTNLLSLLTEVLHEGNNNDVFGRKALSDTLLKVKTPALGSKIYLRV